MELYYVYHHIHPESKEIVYIGVGKFDRAWTCRGGNRSKEHFQFIKEMEMKKFTLADVVKIYKSGMEKKEAFELERQLIDELRPKYNKLSNKDHWQGNRKFEVETCIFAKALHEMGYGYQRIAFLLGSPNYKNSAMSTKRMVSYVS